MPTKLFFALSEKKQSKIINVGITEFAAYGYTSSSTNRIVKNSGISKGSLFKYFLNKEDLYFFILDIVTKELIESTEQSTAALSSELFQRVIEYSTLEFAWYAHNPEKAKIVISAFTKSDTPLYRKTVARYGGKELDVFSKQLEGIDLSGFRWEWQKTIDIFKWFLKGFNEDFLENVQLDGRSFESVQTEYVEKLTGYMEALKTGLFK